MKIRVFLPDQAFFMRVKPLFGAVLQISQIPGKPLLARVSKDRTHFCRKNRKPWAAESPVLDLFPMNLKKFSMKPVLMVAALMLHGCGLKGALTLPKPPATPTTPVSTPPASPSTTTPAPPS